ncbi:MAG: CoA pyrophosphatase [Chloroflexi bacterium]|nr:CoA pyrophosphatase [Chloroflexota bacterium]
MMDDLFHASPNGFLPWLRRRIEALPPEPRDPFGSALPRPTRPAAVLVPLVFAQGAWHLLFLRRAEHPHDPHSGQIAFPGGRTESQDPDARATALREAQEELGLRTVDVTLLAALPPHRTASNYCVTPWLGYVHYWPYPLRLQPDEVAETFLVPLAWLADTRHLERRWRRLATRLVPTYYFRHPRALIWGATARMVVTLLHALGYAPAYLEQGIPLSRSFTASIR